MLSIAGATMRHMTPPTLLHVGAAAPNVFNGKWKGLFTWSTTAPEILTIFP